MRAQNSPEASISARLLWLPTAAAGRRRWRQSAAATRGALIRRQARTAAVPGQAGAHHPDGARRGIPLHRPGERPRSGATDTASAGLALEPLNGRVWVERHGAAAAMSSTWMRRRELGWPVVTHSREYFVSAISAAQYTPGWWIHARSGPDDAPSASGDRPWRSGIRWQCICSRWVVSRDVAQDRCRRCNSGR